MDKGSAEQTSKTLFSTRVCNTSTVAAALQCYFILFFLVTWLKFQKHPKLGDKIVCSEITEFIFFMSGRNLITLSFERNRVGLMSKRKQCLCTCILRRSGRIYSQSTSRVSWRSETEMNIRNPVCNFQHSNGMLKFSRKIALTFAN